MQLKFINTHHDKTARRSCEPLRPTPKSLCVVCSTIVLCGLEPSLQFWLQQPRWVTKSTRGVSIFNLLSVCCHSLRSAPSSRVGFAGCGTTQFGSRRNLPLWREISTAPQRWTEVRPPSVAALWLKVKAKCYAVLNVCKDAAINFFWVFYQLLHWLMD